MRDEDAKTNASGLSSSCLEDVTATCTQCDSLQDKAGKYNSSGDSYERRTYGKGHLKTYQDFRNDDIRRILEDSFPQGRPLQIVEVGCGTGIVLEYLATLAGHHTLFGVDASETMLRQARERVSKRNLQVTVCRGSCDQLPFEDESVDAVLATRFIHLFPHSDRIRIYGEFRRIVKPGGVIAVEYYSRPFAWFRYYCTGLWRRKRKKEFFSHYPTPRQIRELVQGEFRKRPVRLAGGRVLVRLLGHTVLRALTRNAADIPLLRTLIDEYFVVTRK